MTRYSEMGKTLEASKEINDATLTTTNGKYVNQEVEQRNIEIKEENIPPLFSLELSTLQSGNSLMARSKQANSL